jgi:hypothetical protein
VTVPTPPPLLLEALIGAPALVAVSAADGEPWLGTLEHIIYGSDGSPCYLVLTWSTGQVILNWANVLWVMPA